MEDFEFNGPKYSFVCFRCGSVIEAGEKMLSLSIDLESPTVEGSIRMTESTAVSTLCFGCASVLLSQAITREPGLMLPFPKRAASDEDNEEEEPEEEPASASGGRDGPVTASTLRCSQRGFHLALDRGGRVTIMAVRFFR